MRRGCWVVHCDEPRESFWFDIIEFCTIMGDSEDIKYLKQDHIGKVIARGLATVYEQKPSKPITYFANWLLNYSHNQKQIESIKGQQEAKKVNLNEHNQLTQLKSELQEVPMQPHRTRTNCKSRLRRSIDSSRRGSRMKSTI